MGEKAEKRGSRNFSLIAIAGLLLIIVGLTPAVFHHFSGLRTPRDLHGSPKPVATKRHEVSRGELAVELPSSPTKASKKMGSKKKATAAPPQEHEEEEHPGQQKHEAEDAVKGDNHQGPNDDGEHHHEKPADDVQETPKKQVVPPANDKDDAELVPITKSTQMSKYRFFRVQELGSNKWLSRTINENAVSSNGPERTFLVTKVKKYKAFSIKGFTRLHLACENNDKISLDRPWARSFEMWFFKFTDDGKMILQSKKNKKYANLGKRSGTMMATAVSPAKATKFNLFGVISTRCPNEGSEADAENSCWGKVAQVKHTLNDDNDDLPQMPIFGSPKPLKGLEPKNAQDPFDSVTIAKRTLTNWGLLPGLQPLILTTDAMTVKMVEKINGTVPKKFHVGQHYETIAKYDDQPTYRGLFKAALDAFPKSPAVMYSNSDILYTSSLLQTIDKVFHFVEGERERHKKEGIPYNVKGWMIVGQRVNFQVPPSFELDDDVEKWSNTIETDYMKKGELFETDAEDYFIVSRDMFNWDEIPDFIVGGVAFDNWITNRGHQLAKKGEALVVDASRTITALHQNHGHNVKGSHLSPKSSYNSHLAHENGGWELSHTSDALVATERRFDGAITVFDRYRLLTN